MARWQGNVGRQWQYVTWQGHDLACPGTPGEAASEHWMIATQWDPQKYAGCTGCMYQYEFKGISRRMTHDWFDLICQSVSSLFKVTSYLKEQQQCQRHDIDIFIHVPSFPQFCRWHVDMSMSCQADKTAEVVRGQCRWHSCTRPSLRNSLGRPWTVLCWKAIHGYPHAYPRAFHVHSMCIPCAFPSNLFFWFHLKRLSSIIVTVTLCCIFQNGVFAWFGWLLWNLPAFFILLLVLLILLLTVWVSDVRICLPRPLLYLLLF